MPGGNALSFVVVHSQIDSTNRVYKQPRQRGPCVVIHRPSVFPIREKFSLKDTRQPAPSGRAGR